MVRLWFCWVLYAGKEKFQTKVEILISAVKYQSDTISNLRSILLIRQALPHRICNSLCITLIRLFVTIECMGAIFTKGCHFGFFLWLTYFSERRNPKVHSSQMWRLYHKMHDLSKISAYCLGPRFPSLFVASFERTESLIMTPPWALIEVLHLSAGTFTKLPHLHWEQAGLSHRGGEEVRFFSGWTLA